MKSLADFDAKSAQPILETGLSLAEPTEKDVDFDLTLDRGRVEITNVKTTGSATVRVRFWDQSWKIVLDTRTHIAGRSGTVRSLAGRFTFQTG